MSFKEIDPKAIDFTDAPLFRKTATLDKSNVEIAQEEQEVVTTFEDGHEETRNTAYPGDRIITGPEGERYVIKEEKFGKLYEVDPNNPNTFISKNQVRGLLIGEDVTFEAPWGGPMNMKAGSTLCKAGEDDIYGIDQEAFAKTYGRATDDGTIFVSMGASLEEQRAAAAEAGAVSHLRDIDERKSLQLIKNIDTSGVSLDKDR